MLNMARGTVLSCRELDPVTQILQVKCDNALRQAYCYAILTGKCFAGDEVVINTTAVDLNLGTGGYDFVIINLTRPLQRAENAAGHVVKLRYTPLQFSVDVVEQEPLVGTDLSLDGMPVTAAFLHSQVPIVAAGIRSVKQDARIVYVMTDTAALPISFSGIVRESVKAGLIADTITIGQAFGGNIECVNLYSALMTAKLRCGADAVIVCQGPGNVGVGDTLGFSAIQAGESINAAASLGGRSVTALRMSQADARARHRGISHHSITVLSRIALASSIVALPSDPQVQACEYLAVLESTGITRKHEVVFEEGEPGLTLLSRTGIEIRSMGRGVDDDRLFFLASAAAGVRTGKLILDGEA